jgi:hypothetical protein
MKKIEAEECVGEWRMLDDPSAAKRLILKPDGEVRFVGISIEDLRGDDLKGNLSESGTWKLSPNGNNIELWFRYHHYHFNGVKGSESGLLKRKGDGIELWFSVGDPDAYEWKRFRLVKPKAD